MTSGVLTRGAATPGADAMDPRLRARRIEVARTRGRRRLRRIAALVVVAALVVGAVALSRSPVFDVDAVQISGAAQTGTPVAREAVGIPVGRPMISVDTAAARARLERLPWVADARVTKRWPGTIRVEVTERVAVAVAGTGAGSVLVDRDSRILGAASGDERLPMVGPDPGSGSGAGDRLPELRRPIVRIVADLPAELRREVDRGVITEAGLGLVLRDGIRVRLGDATRLGRKAEAIGVLLDRVDRDTIDTIDVAVPDAPALTTDRPGGA